MSFPVYPIYGWGWSAGVNSRDVPSPLRAEKMGGDEQSMKVRVVDEYHEFGGCFAQLSRRTNGPPATYSMLVATHEAQLYDASPGLIAIGFAMLTDERGATARG